MAVTSAKKEIVNHLKDRLSNAKGAVLTTYRGLKIGRAHV